MLSDCKISFQPSILIFRKCFPLIFTSIHIWIIIIETASCIQKSKLQKQKGNKRCLSLLLVVSEWWSWGSRWSIQTPAHHNLVQHALLHFTMNNNGYLQKIQIVQVKVKRYTDFIHEKSRDRRYEQSPSWAPRSITLGLVQECH